MFGHSKKNGSNNERKDRNPSKIKSKVKVKKDYRTTKSRVLLPDSDPKFLASLGHHIPEGYPKTFVNPKHKKGSLVPQLEAYDGVEMGGRGRSSSSDPIGRTRSEVEPTRPLFHEFEKPNIHVKLTADHLAPVLLPSTFEDDEDDHDGDIDEAKDKVDPEPPVRIHRLRAHVAPSRQGPRPVVEPSIQYMGPPKDEPKKPKPGKVTWLGIEPNPESQRSLDSGISGPHETDHPSSSSLHPQPRVTPSTSSKSFGPLTTTDLEVEEVQDGAKEPTPVIQKPKESIHDVLRKQFAKELAALDASSFKKGSGPSEHLIKGKDTTSRTSVDIHEIQLSSTISVIGEDGENLESSSSINDHPCVPVSCCRCRSSKDGFKFAQIRKSLLQESRPHPCRPSPGTYFTPSTLFHKSEKEARAHALPPKDRLAIWPHECIDHVRRNIVAAIRLEAKIPEPVVVTDHTGTRTSYSESGRAAYYVKGSASGFGKVPDYIKDKGN